MMKLKKGKLLIDQHNKNYLYGGKFGGNYVPETLKKPIEDLTNLRYPASAWIANTEDGSM